MLEAERNTEEETRALDRVGDEALADRSADELLNASQRAIEPLKADYERLRKLLYMEQRRPRVFEKDCIKCLRRKNAKLAAATNTLRTMMFSGKTFGSRYLLAALKRNKTASK